MEPRFVITTTVSEQDYRRGLYDGIPKRIIYPGIVFAIFSFFLVGYYSLSFVYDPDLLDFIFLIFMLSAGISLLKSALTCRKKSVQRAIDDLVNNTGSTELKIENSFYDNEITIKNLASGKEGHVLYADISMIRDYDSFFQFQSARNVAVYISKSDIEDIDTLYNFMREKCATAKIVKKS